MRTRRQRVSILAVILAMEVCMFVPAAVQGNTRGMLVWGAFSILMAILLVGAIRDRPLPPLTIQRMRGMRVRVGVGAVVAVSLAVLVALRTENSAAPRLDWLLAGSLGALGVLLMWIVLRISFIVRRGEIPRKMQERYVTAAARRGHDVTDATFPDA